MSASELSLADYKDYLKQVKDIEVSCYRQKRFIQNTNQKISKLYDQNCWINNNQPKEPKKPIGMGDGDNFDCFLLFVLFFIAFGGILGLVIRVIYIWVKNSFLRIDELFKKETLTWIKIGAIAFGVAYFLLCLLGERADVRESKRQYPIEMAEYQKTVQSRKATYNWNQEQIELLTRLNQKNQSELQRTQNLLQRYYNLNVVYPKYRGLVPICTIYEYLESGRCSSLTGPNGAYNLYESELRMNLIIGRLDIIIRKLDEIKRNQYLLYQAIMSSNAQIDRISSAMGNLQNTADSIERNTALSSYYNGITATNAAFMGWLSAYSYDHPNR